MLIGFKYELPKQLYELANKKIPDLNSGYINGWLDEVDEYQLNHCSMYMVCDNEDDVLHNPMAIVARNDMQAVRQFNRITEKDTGTVMCEIIGNCEGVKVIPTGEKIS